MKRWAKMLGGFLIVLLVTFLVACNTESTKEENSADNNMEEEESTDTNTSNESVNEPEPESEEEEVTIVYARGVDTTGANEKVVAAFEEAHPNINVEFREMPADTGQQHDQYVTAFSSQSDEIDVFSGDVIWPAEFAQANYALELDRFIERDGIDMTAYFPGTVAAGNFNGKQWAMPKFTDAGVLYYRSDLVEEPPETWEELIDQASTLQEESDAEFGYLMQASQYEGLITNAIEFIASYGGQIIDEENNVVADSPETIKAIEKMIEIVDSDLTPGNILNFTELETETTFIEGKSVFARNWPYMQASAGDESKSKVVDNVEITTLPEGDSGSASTLGGWMEMINRYTEHPEESWEFVKFVTSTEGQKITAIEGGSAPTLKDLYNDSDVKEASPLFANPEFVKVLDSAVPRPVTPIYPVISDIMQIELSKALAGDQTAEEAAQNMQTEIENAMND